MIRKLTLLILLVCSICIATFMLSQASSSYIETDLKLRKVHQQKATGKGQWGYEYTPRLQYPASNTNCVNQCIAAGGENCGAHNLVCCHSGFCTPDGECLGELDITGCHP